MYKAIPSAISVAEEKTSTIMKSPAPKVTQAPAKIMSNYQAAEVRVCTIDEWQGLALSLAHAFKEDEVAMYFINTPDREHWTTEQKWALHLNIMEYVVYAHLLTGLVTTVGDNYGGVALW
jgi:hypothetical protein